MRVWVEGVQRSLTRFMVFKGLISRRSQKLRKFLGRQVTKVEGVQVNYVVSRSPSSLTTPNSLTTPQAASHASGCLT